MIAERLRPILEAEYPRFSREERARRRRAVEALLGEAGCEHLVFCGANTQPGVGVPMVLISGRLAAERITGRQS